MRTLRVVVIVLSVMLTLVACRRDPATAKKHYLESGNNYFAKGRYKEARIQYENAVKIDARFGPAQYKLGLTYLKLKTALLTPAVKSLRRAVELLRVNGAYQAEYSDAMIRLSEIYLLYAAGDKQAMDDVQSYCDILLKKDADSFDGHRLMGQLNFLRAAQAFAVANKDESKRLLEAAFAEYHKADAAKPGDEGVMMQLAKSYEAQAQYAEAEQLFRKVIDKAKNNPAGYKELYRLYMFEGKPSDAEQVLRLAFQNNPKEFSYLETLAYPFGLQNRRDDMIAVLQQIKSHAKEWDQAYLKVGDFYVRLGDGDTALKEYREGMSKDPKAKTTYLKRIIEVLMRQGKRAEAAEVNKGILKDDPNDPDARGLAATFLLDQGEIAKAISELQAVVTRAPDNPVARYNLGRAHAARGEWAQARLMFQKAIDLRADYVLARLALAQLSVSRGEFDAAYKEADEVIQKYDRNNMNARLIQSAALVGQKRFNDSRTLLGAMLKANPSSPDVYFQLGVVNLAENKFKEAEDSFRRSYELNPANPRGLMGIVETDLAQNKPDAAMDLLQGEARKAPNRMDLLLAMGNTAVRAGRYDEAVANFQKLLEGLDKTSKFRGEVYLRIGETYRRKGDDNSAIANLQKAREVLPDNQMVLSTLALTLDHGGRRDEAKQVYQVTLKMDPNNGVVLNNLSYLMAESGKDLEQALGMATHAKSILPNIPEVSDTLGWIYLKMGNADSAIDTFRDLIVKAPENSTYHYHLAMGYRQKGDKGKAIAELREAMKYNPPKAEQQQIKDLLVQLGG